MYKTMCLNKTHHSVTHHVDHRHTRVSPRLPYRHWLHIWVMLQQFPHDHLHRPCVKLSVGTEWDETIQHKWSSVHSDMPKIHTTNMCADLRKGVTSRIFRILFFKGAYLQNYSSYTLKTRYGYSHIYLLHSLKISSPAHFVYGRGNGAYHPRSENGR